MRTSRSHKPAATGFIAVLVSLATLIAPATDAATSTPVSRTLTVKATPATAMTGTTVAFSGKLSKSPKGSSVRIQRKVGTSWKQVRATSTTTAAGAYSVKVARPTSAGYFKYRAFAPKKDKLKAAYSTVVTVTALRKTVFSEVGGRQWIEQAAQEDTTSAAVGSLKKTFTAGATARLQRKDGTSWVTVGTGTVASSGLFNIAYPHAKSGSHRVVVSRKGLNAAVTSRTQVLTFDKA